MLNKTLAALMLASASAYEVDYDFIGIAEEKPERLQDTAAVGEAISETVLGAENPVADVNPVAKTEVAQIFQGLLEVFGGKFSLVSLVLCLGEADAAYALIVDGSKNCFLGLYAKDIPYTIGGIVEIVAGLKAGNSALGSCPNIVHSE
jgi:hypothetical protein